jgi:hypothetical protein
VRRRVSIIAILAAAALLAACPDRTSLDGPEGAVLTYNDVSELAIETAKANGADLAAYSTPVLSFDKSKSQDQWRASFTLKGESRPGGHFMVLVDDSSKRTKFLPGE